MKLSNKEAKVLSVVELHAELTVREIQDRTGYRAHTIRHALGHLREYEIIKRQALINLCPLGYCMHNLYLSLENDTNQSRGNLIITLLKEPQILSIVEVGTDFQYCLGICAQSISEVCNIVKRIVEKSKVLIAKKSISTKFSTSLLPRRYLNSAVKSSNGICLNAEGSRCCIDDFDRSILGAVTRYGEATHPALARELKVPLTTLDARIKKLEEKKIIAGYLYKVIPSKFDMYSYTLLVHAKDFNQQIMKKLNHFSNLNTSIVRVDECFGSWDFELGIEVRMPNHVSEVVHQLYELLGEAISAVKVLSHYQELKSCFYPCSQTNLTQIAA